MIRGIAQQRPLHRWRNTALALLFPERCRACDGPMTDGVTAGSRIDPPGAYIRRLLAGELCRECLETVRAITSPMCTRCGLPFAGGGDHLCGRCMNATAPPGRVRSAGVYEGALMALIHRYKYQRCIHLAGVFATMVARTVRAHWAPDEIDLMVPVPLSGRRMRRRGFNQAWQLMKSFHRGKADRSLLHRVRRTVPQTGLTRRERRQNLAGAFAVRNPAALVGRRVMVVDDVMTTGATLNACAEALLAAGAARVDAVTLARTIQEAA